MPEFTITASRDALFPAIAAARDAIERRNTIPILSNLFLRADDAGQLIVSGTDLDIAMTSRTGIPAHALGERGITIPGDMLTDILRKLPPKADVTLAMAAGSNGQAILTSGRARFTLPTLPAEDFPTWVPDETVTASFTISAGRLAAMLTLVSFAISTEETRFYLNGIYLHTVDGDGGLRLRTVATDGHRLALAEHDAIADLPALPGVIVPRKTVAVMQKVLKDAGDETEVTVSVTDSRITFALPSLTIVSKVIDGTYPDYPRVMPAGNANRWRFDARPLADAADRVATVAGERGRATVLEWEDDRVSLSVVNPDAGDAADEVPVTCDSGSPVRIGFNGLYLAQMLTRFDGAGLAYLGDGGTPALFLPARKGDDAIEARFVLMPMRV